MNMFQFTRPLLPLVLPLAFACAGVGLVACGGSDSGDAAEAAVASGGSAGSAGSSAAGAAGTAGAAGGAGGGTAGMAGALPTQFGTYIELGDSISDKGGNGPFFYDLFFQNDDAAYPAWAGMDLKTKFGVQQHVHGSKAGAESIDMPGQVDKLPTSLPGPVLVSITIGGNDVQSNAADIVQGKDGPARDKFRARFQQFLGKLKEPGRFGAGVEVYVLEADIYDPSDGQGNFAEAKCPGILAIFPKQPTDGFIKNWNDIVVEEVSKAGIVLPAHDTFYGHGISNKTDGWYNADCIHPNKRGHHEMRRLFWKTLTGKDGPALSLRRRGAALVRVAPLFRQTLAPRAQLSAPSAAATAARASIFAPEATSARATADTVVTTSDALTAPMWPMRK